MGKRGPPPKPSALKKQQGTYRKDRAASNEVVAPVGSPPKPEDLPPLAARRWDALVPILLERGTLAVEDGATLEAHCRAYASWQQCQKIAEAAPILKDPKRGLRTNPAAAEARKWESRVTATGDRLGLSASARSRVGGKEAEKELDELEEFFKPVAVEDLKLD